MAAHDREHRAVKVWIPAVAGMTMGTGIRPTTSPPVFRPAESNNDGFGSQRTASVREPESQRATRTNLPETAYTHVARVGESPQAPSSQKRGAMR
jgi:hypothetical protein